MTCLVDGHEYTSESICEIGDDLRSAEGCGAVQPTSRLIHKDKVRCAQEF